MSRKWLLPITIMCFIAGFFLTFQLKVMAGISTVNPISERNTNLITIINDLEEEIKNQEELIGETRDNLDKLQEEQIKGRLQELQDSLKTAKILAGLTPVAGKGIVITVDDNTEGLKANPDDDPNKYIIHYSQLLNIVSELKVGGAEAISINGQRLITTSEIRCVGNLILINTTRIAPPFEISAIGSPRLLAEIVTASELAIMKLSNYPVDLKEVEELIIPAYKGDLQFKYAQTKGEN